jgi:outer membrane protein TolC
MHSRNLSCRSLLCVLAVALSSRAGAAAGAEPASQPPASPSLEPTEPDPLLAPPRAAAATIASWDDALSLVRERSPDYLSNAKSIDRAAAQKRIALAAVLPTLTGQGSYTHQFMTEQISIGNLTVVTPSPDLWFAGATLSWNLLNPRGLYGVGTADQAIAEAKLSFEDRRRAIAGALVDAMLATLAGSRVADLNRIGLRAALDRLALTKARLEFGQGTVLDVDRAEQDAAASRETLIAGDESLEQARENLGTALGSAVPTALPDGTDLTSFEGAVARTCRLNADIEKRPDVAAARLRVELAQRAVTDAELQIAPSLGLVSQLGYASEPVLAPNATWSVEGVLTVPFYDGGARYGALRDARAAVEQARQTLVATRLAAIVDSARTERSVRVLGASREVARTRRDLAARIDARTRDGYSRGLGTSLDLVTSAESLRDAEISLALLEFQVSSARAHAVLANAECVY